MIGQTAIVAGVLFAAAVYLMLSRNTQRIAVGFLLLSNAVNLLVLTAAGVPARGQPPLLDGNPGVMVDPLPQAFLLTAIVIGLAAAAFLMAMAARAYEAGGSDELDGAADGTRGKGGS
jgi:multicomponent Na+:H+ antiporter subunit C